MSLTSPDWSAELQEALWETARQFGVRLEVAEQVAIARYVSRKRVEAVSPQDVRAAFAAVNLPRPSTAYATAVLRNVKSVGSRRSLLDVLLAFRGFAIEALSREFGGKTKGRENELRNYLRTYLPEHGFAEAHTGKGRTDILLPAPLDAVVEVKVWTTLRVYQDGLVELGRYIHTYRPKQAFMVVFGDRDPLPSIISDHRQEIAAEEPLEGLTVPVVVVPFEVDAPSKAATEQRRRTRDKR